MIEDKIKSQAVRSPAFYCSRKECHFQMTNPCHVKAGDSFSLYETKDSLAFVRDLNGAFRVHDMPHRSKGFFCICHTQVVRYIQEKLQTFTFFHTWQQGDMFCISKNKRIDQLESEEMNRKEFLISYTPENGVQLLKHEIRISPVQITEPIRCSLYESENTFALIREKNGSFFMNPVHQKEEACIRNRNLVEYLYQKTGRQRFQYIQEVGTGLIFSGIPFDNKILLNSMRKIYLTGSTIQFHYTSSGEKQYFVRIDSNTFYFPYKMKGSTEMVLMFSLYESDDGVMGLFPDDQGVLKLNQYRQSKYMSRVNSRLLSDYILTRFDQSLLAYNCQEGDRFFFSDKPFSLTGNHTFKKVDLIPFRKQYVELYDQPDRRILIVYRGRNILTPRVSFYRYENIWAVAPDRNGDYSYTAKNPKICCADLIPRMRATFQCGEYARLPAILREGIVYFGMKPFRNDPPDFSLFDRMS